MATNTAQSRLKVEEGMCDKTDENISNVLDEVVKRPLFVNLSKPRDTTATLPMILPDVEEADIEMVGSSRDGLKVGKVFDVGDVDALILSNTISFDKEDESTFEYRTDNPCFFHVPQPKILSDLLPVDGKYLNADFLRCFHSSIFGSKTKKPYSYIPYTILPASISRDRFKCATTPAIPYSDPVFEESMRAPDTYLDNIVYLTWQMEHVLFTHLLLLKNQSKTAFVKELLYGSDCSSTGEETIKLLKQHIRDWKQDAQKIVFSCCDMLYFKSNEFQDLLHKALSVDLAPDYAMTAPHGEYSADLVPAVRCSAWPEPALSFQTRKRKWPSKQVVDSIVESGFQVVAKSCPVNPLPDKDFILSFSPAEMKLALALPSDAVLSYCLLKLCYKSMKEGQDEKLLKTFHLKTALFWVAENTEPTAWEKIGLLSGIRSIISFLLDCLRNHNFPSFFVPTNNLISHFARSDVDRASKILRSIHENPANYIKLLIDKEWEFTRVTMPEDSFRQIQEPGYYSSISWAMQIKLMTYGLAKAGDYPIDEMMDVDEPSKLRSLAFYEQFVSNPLSRPPSGNTPFICDITDDQLLYVDIFLQTVKQMDIDLYNVLDQDISTDISGSTVEWITRETLDLYPQYDKKADDEYGERLIASMKLRLKFYGNVFHVLYFRLTEARFSLLPHENQDVAYIVNFLEQLEQRRAFTAEDTEDLFHYLLYFCHFTRLRHHKLKIEHQIVRSIREFLQDAKHLMTIYFNPREVFPVPVDCGDAIVTVLGECFQRDKNSNSECCVM